MIFRKLYRITYMYISLNQSINIYIYDWSCKLSIALFYKKNCCDMSRLIYEYMPVHIKPYHWSLFFQMDRCKKRKFKDHDNGICKKKVKLEKGTIDGWYIPVDNTLLL